MNTNIYANVAGLSTSTVKNNVKYAVMNEMDLSGLIQVDSYKWAIPVECDDNVTRYVELSLVCKGDDYDVLEKRDSYLNKVERAEKREQERIEKRKERLEQLSRECGEE